jgi:serine/threonine-protein kinase
MGRVYLAHHTRLQRRRFALKVLIGDLASTLEMRMRFAHEAEAASRLDHPNVVPVVDFGKTEDGLMFLAMDFVDGVSLDKLIATQAPIAPSRAIAIARQLGLGLEHAHERGLVHRDFKPENVIVVGNGSAEVPRILDFGLAIASDDEIAARLTTAGVTLGTPIYASPEQTHNEPIDHRADLFALGVTMYEMLAGAVPFEGNALEIMHRNATERPPPIATRSGVTVPASLERLVARLMARSPDDRFATARDVVDALDDVAAELADNAPTVIPDGEAATIAPTARPPGRKRRGIAIGIAALLCVGAGLSAIAYLSRTDPRTVRPAPVIAHTTSPPIQPAPDRVPSDAPVPRPGALPIEPHDPVTHSPEPVTKPPPAGSNVPAGGPARRPNPKPAAKVARRTGGPDVSSPSVDAKLETPTPPPDAMPEAPVAIVAPAPHRPEPAAPPPVFDAHAAIAALTVHGSLSNAEIRRAVERVIPELQACYRTVARAARRNATATVHASLVIDDTRRPTEIRASQASWPELANCAGSALRSVRTNIAPDVGTVEVSLDVSFTPERP